MLWGRNPNQNPDSRGKRKRGDLRKIFREKGTEEYLNTTVELSDHQKTSIFYLLAFSGMRVGESCSLKWPWKIEFSRDNGYSLLPIDVYRT